jgi:hypothetical protein
MSLGDQLGISAENWLERMPLAPDGLLLSRNDDGAG